MLRTGMLHPQLARVLAKLGHRDTIITGDAGLPVPEGVGRVDLGWRLDDPAYLNVLEETFKYIAVKGVMFADEALTVTPDFHKKALELLPQGLPVEYTPHTEPKERSKDVKTIVLTGELTEYTNVILVAGCVC